MATADLQVSSVIDATGWTGATQANLSSSNDVRATDGDKFEIIKCELDNAPGDFGSLNSVTLKVEGLEDPGALRTHQFLVELLDSGDTVLESFTTANLTSTDTLYASSAFTRSDAKSVVDGYRLQVTVQEGGGMAGTEKVEVDHMFVTIDYNVASTDRRLRASWAELEVPTAPRRLRASWAELEAPDAPRRLRASWAELEVPDAPRRLRASWAELEVPTAPRRLRASWAELEVPDAPVTDRRLQASWAELEVPTAPRRLRVSWAEVEAPSSSGLRRHRSIASRIIRTY